MTDVLFPPLQYEVENVGSCGGGGEYAVQAGFGWTNGVIFELLDQYGTAASSNDDPGQLTRPARGLRLTANTPTRPNRFLGNHLQLVLLSSRSILSLAELLTYEILVEAEDKALDTSPLSPMKSLSKSVSDAETETNKVEE